MPGCDTPAIRGATFDANCAALERRQPGLVKRLREVSIPETAEVVDGRDGLPVIRLAAGDESVTWLGGSSMPSVSAPIAVSGFQNRGVNAALASIGTGYEADYLARRLPPHCAVFVCEPCTATIALALSAVDMRGLLDAGRIVLLDGELDESLCTFMVANPGYSGPEQLFGLFDADPGEIAQLSATLGRGAERACELRPQAPVALNKKAPSAVGEHPAFAVLSIDAVGGAVGHARQIAAACESLGWPVVQCVPDAPDRCHVYARLTTVAESDADALLCINSTPQAVGIPEETDFPSACWFLEGPALPSVVFEGLEQCSVVLASSTAVRNLLVEEGADPDSIAVIEAGVDDSVFATTGDSQSERERIVVCCDAVDTSPRAAGISLESHERLWRAAEVIIADATREGALLDTATILKRAERVGKSPLSEENVRTQLANTIAARLVKSVVARTLIERVLESHAVDVWGVGWDSHDSVRDHVRGSLGTADSRRRAYERSQLIVLPYPDEAAMQLAREALAAGACPMLRRPAAELLARYPQTGDILRKVPQFASAEDLANAVQAVLSGDESSIWKCDKLGEHLRSQHTVRHRLLDLRRRLQSLPA